MFIGEYLQTVDAKFRVNVPAGFRAELGQTFEWEGFLNKIKERKKLLFFTSGSKECELDTQGRVVIPPDLREYLGLKKEIAVVGTFRHVEIWNRDAWNEYFDDDEYSAENIGKIMEEHELI